MYYGHYFHPSYFSPWGWNVGPAYPMFGGWPGPYPPYWGMGQIPVYPSGVGGSPFGPPIPPEYEVEALKNHAQMLKQELDYINERIQEIEKNR